MPRFTFPYPVKPWRLTQGWGIYNPAYQRFGFTRHNGVDVAPGENKEIRAPFAGTIVRTGNQPDGGGIFCGLFSNEEYSFDDGLIAKVLMDSLHCERLLVKEGQSVVRGQLIAIADNTGFSTGPHTHIQLRRGNWNDPYFVPADSNHANNSFDPAPYYTGTYVVDEELAAARNIWAEILAAVSSLLKGRSQPTP